jgi:hypothetical protein
LSSPVTGQVLTGQLAGVTFTSDQIADTGMISANSLTLGAKDPQIETLRYSNGTVQYRICSKPRVLLRLQWDEECLEWLSWVVQG